MKAIIFSEYGKPDVLQLADMPDPVAGKGEVRIRIAAAGVNPIDTKIRRGQVRERIPHQLPVIPGWDAAGVVDQVGEGTSLHKAGDKVYAYCRKPIVQYGTYANYIVLPEEQVAAMPVSMTFEQAASVPLAALTAWQSLFDAGRLVQGQSVLVHAGAGGVGGFAIQLARNAGARIVSTASAEKHDYVRGLGADEVLDYRAEDFREGVRRFYPDGVDLVFDTVGGDVQMRSGDVVRKNGTLVSILKYGDEAALQSLGINTRYVFVAPNREQLGRLARLIDSGKLRTHLAHVWPLADAVRAHETIEDGHTAGKIVLVTE